MYDSLPAWMHALISHSLIGEIYSDIRAVAAGWDEQERELVLRFYMDRDVNDDDYDNIDLVATNILAAIGKNEEIKNVKEEVVFSKDPGNIINPLSAFIYFRKEYLD